MAISYKTSPFESLPSDMRSSIESQLVRTVYKPKKHLYRIGESSRGLIWFRAGIALSYRSDEDGELQGAIPIYRGVWTAPSVMSGTHIISQRAVTECIADVLPLPRTQAWLSEPAFANLIGKWCTEDYALVAGAMAFAEEVRAPNVLLNYLRTVVKLARYDHDADLADIHGEIDWPFSITDLSKFVQVSRPYASRMIKAFTRDRFLKIAQKKLTIFDSEKPA